MNMRISALIPLLLVLGATLSAPAFAEVYRVVDKDGNVIYTDQPPETGAEPMKLPELSVVEATPMTPPAAADVTEEDAEQQVTDIRELRRGYKDFSISSPKPEEFIEGSGNEVTIGWTSRYALQPGMMVMITLDGRALEPTTASSVTVKEVDRGEHIVQAQLVDARNRRIATASPVTFFVRQFSQNFRGN